jgi:hypothetical protein
MIRLLLAGIWASVLSLAAAYAMMHWSQNPAAAIIASGEKKLEEVRTRAINVPIIGEGTVQGYMVAQFVFTVDATALKEMKINPEVYLLDEAFKTIYANEQINFQNIKKQDLPLLAKRLGDNVNKRLGAEIVQDVLIDQLAYIPKKDVRGPSRS